MFKFTAYHPEHQRLMKVIMPTLEGASEFAEKLRSKGYKVPGCVALADAAERFRAEDFAQQHADGNL